MWSKMLKFPSKYWALLAGGGKYTEDNYKYGQNVGSHESVNGMQTERWIYQGRNYIMYKIEEQYKLINSMKQGRVVLNAWRTV
jgi:hypothetical protein